MKVDFQKKIKNIIHDEKKLIELITSMHNRIEILEKHKVDKKDFNDYKRKKKGWFSQSSSFKDRRSKSRRRNN